MTKQIIWYVVAAPFLVPGLVLMMATARGMLRAILGRPTKIETTGELIGVLSALSLFGMAGAGLVAIGAKIAGF